MTSLLEDHQVHHLATKRHHGCARSRTAPAAACCHGCTSTMGFVVDIQRPTAGADEAVSAGQRWLGGRLQAYISASSGPAGRRSGNPTMQADLRQGGGHAALLDAWVQVLCRCELPARRSVSAAAARSGVPLLAEWMREAQAAGGSAGCSASAKPTRPGTALRHRRDRRVGRPVVAPRKDRRSAM
jgi:hypothetical protein